VKERERKWKGEGKLTASSKLNNACSGTAKQICTSERRQEALIPMHLKGEIIKVSTALTYKRACSEQDHHSTLTAFNVIY